MDRAAHAQALLASVQTIQANLQQADQGAYLNIQGRPGQPMALDSLDASGLDLLQFKPSRTVNEGDQAVVFATTRGLEKLQQKIVAFETQSPKRKKDGTDGSLPNAKLVQGIEAITEAALRSLWRSAPAKFPVADATVQWEVWIWPKTEAAFRQAARQANIHVSNEGLKFPEDLVIVATCNQQQLAQLVAGRGHVKSLALLATLPSFFDDLPPEDQSDRVNSLSARTIFEFGLRPAYVTVLDTGVSRAHPLINPALDAADRFAAKPEWTVEDNNGHGTKMAGLALFGDLTLPLRSGLTLTINHKLESVKVFPDVGHNEHDLLGSITERAVETAEVAGNRRRVFSLATSTSQDTPHDGAPTSWSSALDKICFGSTDRNESGRLLAVSAGNTNQDLFRSADYLAICDSSEHELESPAQAWNAISVGAFTEKATLVQALPGSAYAPVGDLSPSSRTASWHSIWPLKPDIVMEGGNWWNSGAYPPMKHADLEVLTTHYQHPQRSFCSVGQTSAATALASRQLAMLWHAYPDFWPETIRALYVASARWTQQMRSHLPVHPLKGHYGTLFQRYGYGVPDFLRAMRSASNCLTLIVQDTIVPYGRSETSKSRGLVNKELKLFELPWPKTALRELGNTNVTLRIALSSFILPNPSEASRGKKYFYASHNLRFKLNRPDESTQQFLSRISGSESEEENGQLVDDSSEGWTFGVNRRDVGSLHIDELTCRASDLARRNLLAVHPVAGWWKSQTEFSDQLRSVRFSLVVEIDAESVVTDLYTEVANAIAVEAVIRA